MSSKNEFETRCGWKRDGHVVSQALPSLSHTREGVSAREQDSSFVLKKNKELQL